MHSLSSKNKSDFFSLKIIRISLVCELFSCIQYAGMDNVKYIKEYGPIKMGIIFLTVSRFNILPSFLF